MTQTTETMTKADAVKAYLAVCRAVADTVRDVGRAPAGVVYAALMTYGCSLAAFERIVGVLVEGRLVRREGHELVWCGPTA